MSSAAQRYLQDDGEDDERPDARHHATEVGEQGLVAASGPDVQLLDAVVVVVVGGVIGQVMLDAGPGGAGVTAAEGDAVHQVFPLHVTENTAVEQTQEGDMNPRMVGRSIPGGDEMSLNFPGGAEPPGD